MQHMREEVWIEAPVEHVWGLFCDTSQWAKLMPRNAFSDFSGPIDRVGTTYVTTMRLLGFERKETLEIVEVEPLRLIHEHAVDGPMDNHFRFEPDGAATRVSLESDFEVPVRLPGFVKDIVRRRFSERYTREVLADLKALAEAEIPASDP